MLSDAGFGYSRQAELGGRTWFLGMQPGAVEVEGQCWPQDTRTRSGCE